MITPEQIDTIRKILHTSGIVKRTWLFGYFKLMTNTNEMEETLGKRVDFISMESIISGILYNVNKDRKLIYENCSDIQSA